MRNHCLTQQTGLMPSRSITDHIPTFRLIIEKVKKELTSLYCFFRSQCNLCRPRLPLEHLDIPCYHFPVTRQQLRHLGSCDQYGLGSVGKQGCGVVPDLQPSMNPGLLAGWGQLIWRLSSGWPWVCSTILNPGRNQNLCASASSSLNTAMNRRRGLATAAMQSLWRPWSWFLGSE